MQCKDSTLSGITYMRGKINLLVVSRITLNVCIYDRQPIFVPEMNKSLYLRLNTIIYND